MRHLDESPLDPDIGASLEAIDATLTGEPVDPKHAELAELALLLAAGRPEMRPSFAASLEDRVNTRFAPAKDAAPSRRWAFARARSSLFASAGAAALAAAVVAVVVVSSGGSGASSGASTPSLTTAASPATSAGSAASGATRQPLTQPPPAGATGAPVAPQPPTGRKVIQSAQLSLSAPPNRIDAVAQQVFNVIGAQNGIVENSTVTATGGPDGYAQFQLSVPSSSLGRTMSELSGLRDANVVSRTDSTRDVNNQYVSEARRLADARALRTALLGQLAHAVTTAQIDSLTARIHDAEASIVADEASLKTLNQNVGQSRIALTINAGVALPHPAPSHGGSFTVGKAAHDAGRVLTVAAGVALIALAALIPVALIGALGAWIAVLVRRRRREQALDLA